MSAFSKGMRQLDRARQKALANITGGASDSFGRGLRNMGVPTNARALILRTAGRRNLGAFGYRDKIRGGGGFSGKTRSDEVPTATNAANNGYCDEALNPLTGRPFSDGIPFALKGVVRIAAGALTQGTDLADYHDATSNPTIITTNNLVPGEVKTVRCRLWMSAAFAASPTETPADIIGGFQIVERVSGYEVGRYDIEDFGLRYGEHGFVTSGMTSFATEFSGKFAPLERDYDPNVTHEFALQNVRTFTSVAIISSALSEVGTRKAAMMGMRG